MKPVEFCNGCGGTGMVAGEDEPVTCPVCDGYRYTVVGAVEEDE